MSLILEALKKLERDRHANDRGFLVLAQPWAPAGERSWTRAAPLLAGAALAGAAVAAALLWPARAQEKPAAEAAVPVAPPAALAAAPQALAPQRPAAPARVAWPVDAGRGPAARERVAPEPVAPRPAVHEPAEPAEPPAAEDEPAAEPVEEQAAAGPLRLEAISQREGEPVAVVSGEMVRVGDRIGPSTVVRIGVTEVELETDGRRHVLRF